MSTPRRRHSKKEVEQALRQAGWTVTPMKAGHRWGKAECGAGCCLSIWSTPKSPGNHAKAIGHAVKRCPHEAEEASK